MHIVNTVPLPALINGVAVLNVHLDPLEGIFCSYNFKI